MADKIDLSLDDIIKINKKKDRSNKPKVSTRNTNPKVLKSRIRPKIQSHQQQQHQQQTRDSGPAMLHVANLHFGVSDKDLRELFEEIGKIKKAAVHYDKSGRSIGTAEVIFWSRDDATRAIKTYNQRILDGRPMNITLVPSRTTTVASNNNGSNATRGIGIKKGSGIQKRSPQKMGGRNQTTRSPKKGGGSMNNKGPRRQGTKSRPAKKEISAEELDKDLDGYLNNNKMNVD